MMLTQLIYTLVLLCVYLLLLILFNYLGMQEEMNLLLSSLVFSGIASSKLIPRLFFMWSCFYLLALTLTLTHYELVPYLAAGLVGGYAIGVYLQNIEQDSEHYAARLLTVFKRSSVSYPQRFKPQRQKNSDHA